ncbi:MAG TPA: fatty acyl-AMP ligase [Streptosporangiaceae bacterium]|nr:fatty acyl-AMP ligase [Streptosporangiaceae bacterium]
MSARTMTEVLLTRAAEKPGAVAYGFLADGEDAVAELTYGDLATQSRRIAALLADRLSPGSRAILVYPPGLEFVMAFFGCLLAGVIAVPAYPPAPPVLNEGVRRLRRVAADAGAEAVLTSSAYHAFRAATPEIKAAVEPPWLVTDRERIGDPDAWRDGGIDADTVAMIQYTSGSTADPKGVVLRHGNLMANQRAIQQAMGAGDRTVGVSWLPMYHDMGLIGFILQPLYLGIPSYLLSPLHFLERPVRWLRAVSRFRGTVSGGPNFAYELCVKRITDEEKDGLDLSSWRVAFTGSDHVHATPLRRFAERFADRGLRPEALYPCYGLAEASLLVTGSVPLGGPRTVRLDAAALAEGAARPGEPAGARTVESVSCGRPPEGHEVVVVDPEQGAALPEGRVGEIWVRGPSVAAGYWNRPEPSEATFRAYLPGHEEPFLRTGDLGFLLGGELHVTGRIKDVMIVRGRNVYPQDVEIAAQEADGRTRAGGGAAFGIQVAGAEEVALVQEVSAAGEAETAAMLRRIRQAVSDAQGIGLAAICLVPPRTLPRTSSGKIRRAACREMFRRSELAPLAEWRDTGMVRM